MSSNPKYFQTKINANKMPPEVSRFREAKFPPRTIGDFSTSTERREQVKCQTPNARSATRAPTSLLALRSLLITPRSFFLAPPFSLLPPPSNVVGRRLLCRPALSAPLPPASLRGAALHPSPNARPSPGNPVARCLSNRTTAPARRPSVRPRAEQQTAEGRGGVVSSGVANNTKADAVVFQNSFSPRAHRLRRLPSFLPFCLATRLSQCSSSALFRNLLLQGRPTHLPEPRCSFRACRRTPGSWPTS